MNIFLPKQYIIYGAMRIGGNWDSDSPITESQKEAAFIALDAAIDGGIKFFDLADIYMAGKSELVMGYYLDKHPGLREDIIIQSKVGIHLNETSFGSIFDFSYDHIIKSVDEILERLNTHYLDILLLHRPDPLLDRDEFKKAIDELFNTGKIRALGVSNMDHHQIQLLEAYSGRKIIVNQLELSLKKSDFVDSHVGFNNSGDRSIDFPIGTLEHGMLNDISLQSWSPLAHGIFSGVPFDDHVLDSVTKTSEVVKRLSDEKSVSREAIVLAWLLKHPANIKPVIGTMNPQRIKNCLEALTVELTRVEWYELLVASRGVAMP